MKRNYRKISIMDFSFRKTGSGHYYVTYTSPNTGSSIGKTITDMTIIDATKNEDFPKKKDLEHLKKMIKLK